MSGYSSKINFDSLSVETLKKHYITDKLPYLTKERLWVPITIDFNEKMMSTYQNLIQTGKLEDLKIFILNCPEQDTTTFDDLSTDERKVLFKICEHLNLKIRYNNSTYKLLIVEKPKHWRWHYCFKPNVFHCATCGAISTEVEILMNRTVGNYCEKCIESDDNLNKFTWELARD